MKDTKFRWEYIPLLLSVVAFGITVWQGIQSFRDPLPGILDNLQGEYLLFTFRELDGGWIVAGIMATFAALSFAFMYSGIKKPDDDAFAIGIFGLIFVTVILLISFCSSGWIQQLILTRDQVIIFHSFSSEPHFTTPETTVTVETDDERVKGKTIRKYSLIVDGYQTPEFQEKATKDFVKLYQVAEHFGQADALPWPKELVSLLGEIQKGEGIDAAGELSVATESDEEHPLRIVLLTPEGFRHPWDKQKPESWNAKWPSDVQLIAWIDERKESTSSIDKNKVVLKKSNNFLNTKTTTEYWVKDDRPGSLIVAPIQIYEARTGKLFAEGIIPGTPKKANLSGEPGHFHVHYSGPFPPTFQDAKEWLDDIVNRRESGPVAEEDQPPLTSPEEIDPAVPDVSPEM